MNEAILYSLMGLGAGGFFALMAMGIVAAYKGSGVINFAHGALAMYVAFQFYYLRSEGMFFLPWFDILPTKTLNLPVRLSLNNGVGLSVWVATVLALLTSLMLGAGVHYLVFKPLRNAAPLGKVVGAVGAMTYLLGLGTLHFGATIPNPEAVLFKGGVFRNFLNLNGTVSQESLSFAALAVVLGGGVWWFYRFTRTGLATRAAAGNEKGAVLLGFSPDRLALYNWLLSTVLAGVTGIFSGTILGSLDVSKYTALIVPALGAALIGRLSSIPLAVAGGLGIGMLQNFTGTWMAGESWFPEWARSGVREAVPLVIIIIVLFAQGKSLPIRGNIEEKRLPLAPYPKRIGKYVAIFVPLGFIFAAGLPGDWGWGGLSGPWGFAFTVTLATAMLALSMILLSGYVGQISLIQITLAGIAAFVTGRLVSKSGVEGADFDPFAVTGPGWPWPLAAAVGVFAAVCVGLVLAIPALRIRGVQLAVVTISAAIAIYYFFLDNQSLTKLQGGTSYKFPAPTLFGVDIGSTSSTGLTDSTKFALFALVVLAGLCVFVANIRRGSSGRRFLAVRANERAAAAAGIDVARTKLLAFGLSSAVAGVAGVMMAYQSGSTAAPAWTYSVGLSALAFVYIGGITSINGAVLGGIIAGGGIVAFFGTWHSPSLFSYTPIMGGIGMILTAIIHPAGQASIFQPLMQHLGGWLIKARGAEWLTSLRRYGPYLVLGGVWGALGINPWRGDDFSRFWMGCTGVFLVIFIRSIAVQVVAARKAKAAAREELEKFLAQAEVVA